jgi:hypothetical protein
MSRDSEYYCDDCMARCPRGDRICESYGLCSGCWYKILCENCDKYPCYCGKYSPNGAELGEYICVQIYCDKLCKYKKGYATKWQSYRLCKDCYTNKLCDSCELYPCICIKEICKLCEISKDDCDCCEKCHIYRKGMCPSTCDNCDKCDDCCECDCGKCQKCQKKEKNKDMCNICINICNNCCDCEICKNCEKRIFKVQPDMHVKGYIFKQVKYDDLDESDKNDFCGCK